MAMKCCQIATLEQVKLFWNFETSKSLDFSNYFEMRSFQGILVLKCTKLRKKGRFEPWFWRILAIFNTIYFIYRLLRTVVRPFSNICFESNDGSSQTNSDCSQLVLEKVLIICRISKQNRCCDPTTCANPGPERFLQNIANIFRCCDIFGVPEETQLAAFKPIDFGHPIKIVIKRNHIKIQDIWYLKQSTRFSCGLATRLSEIL